MPPTGAARRMLYLISAVEREMDWAGAKAFTRRVAEQIAEVAPDRYTTSAALAKRPGRLFIDYLRNGRGTTAVGAYSPRARHGFPIAAPVTWSEVEKGIGRDAYTLDRLPRRRRERIS